MQLERDASRINWPASCACSRSRSPRRCSRCRSNRSRGCRPRPAWRSWARATRASVRRFLARSLARRDLESPVSASIRRCCGRGAEDRNGVGSVERDHPPGDRGPEPSRADIEIAATKAVARNIRLMGLATTWPGGGVRRRHQDHPDAADPGRGHRAGAAQLRLHRLQVPAPPQRQRPGGRGRAAGDRRHPQDRVGGPAAGARRWHARHPVLGLRAPAVHATGAGGRRLPRGAGRHARAERGREAALFLELLFDPKVKPALLEPARSAAGSPGAAAADPAGASGS